MYGSGSITQCGRNVYRVRVSAGTDANGKRLYATRTVHGTKTKAKQVCAALKAELDGGLKLDGDKVRLSEFAEVWADSKRVGGKSSERGVRDALSHVKKVARVTDDARLRDLTPQVIESAYSALKSEGLSGTTLHHIHTDLKACLEKACDYDLLMRNPAAKVDAPRVDSPARKSLSAEDAAELRRALIEAQHDALAELSAKEGRQLERGNAFGRGFVRGVRPVSCIVGARLVLATGMRRGEILALSWGDCAGGFRKLRVAHSLTNDNELKAPKTKAGVRTVSLDGSTADALKEWKARQASELAKFGVRQTAATPICCDSTGGFINPANFTHWWGEFREQAGFPGLKLHELRHTQATLLLANGVDVKTVQTRLGHSSGSVTLDWYAHAIPENDGEAAELMGSLTAPKPRIINVKTA